MSDSTKYGNNSVKGDKQNFIIDRERFQNRQQRLLWNRQDGGSGDKNYQISIQVVEIGSKPKEEKKEK